MSPAPAIDYNDKLPQAYREHPKTLTDYAQAEMARREFRAFVPIAWDIVEPDTTFAPGWHIDCICDHLQGVAEGHIRRLLINVPPRHMKTLLVSVMYPAWKWIHDPAHRFIGTSYSMTNALQYNTDSRAIIRDERFRRLLPVDAEGNKWKLAGDQNSKSMFENDKRGRRFATSTGGALTGQGCDTFIADDPHNIQDISANSLQAVKDWWTQAVPSRLNDPKTSSKIVVQQRVHSNDLTGVIIEGGEEFAQVVLPARYEGHCRITGGWLKAKAKKKDERWVDPRKRNGEPLWKALYNSKALRDNLENVMSAYAIAGQLQQRPAPRDGGIFKEESFLVVDTFDESLISKSCRFFDKAGTDDGGDYTAGPLVHLLTDGRVVIADMLRGQWSVAKRERRMKNACLDDYVKYCNGKRARYHIKFEQEGGSGGKDSATMTKNNLLYDDFGTPNQKFSILKGAKVSHATASGSKVTRAERYEALVENGCVLVLNRPWTKAFMDEHCVFPNGANDDQVDATSCAINTLMEKTRRAGGLRRRG